MNEGGKKNLSIHEALAKLNPEGHRLAGRKTRETSSPTWRWDQNLTVPVWSYFWFLIRMIRKKCEDVVGGKKKKKKKLNPVTHTHTYL